jgi:predicted amidohydrolase YtcJ
VKAKGIYAGGTDQKIYRWMELNSDYIKAIGGDDSIPAAEDHEVQVIDLSDYFILPGLIDSHIHVNMVCLHSLYSCDSFTVCISWANNF